MPITGLFGFNVLVNGEPLWEYTAEDGKIYVESSVQTEASYKMPGANGEQMMVTPYTISIQSQHPSEPMFCILYVDGKRIARSFIRPGLERMMTGIREKNTLREFVFMFPDEPSKQANSSIAINSVGEIEVMAYEALDTGKREKYFQNQFCPVQSQGPASGPSGFFNVISKKDVHHRTEGHYPLLYTQAGRAVSSAETCSFPRFRTKHNKGRLLASVKLYYRPRLALQILGVLPKHSTENVPDSQKDEDCSPQDTSLGHLDLSMADCSIHSAPEVIPEVIEIEDSDLSFVDPDPMDPKEIISVKIKSAELSPITQVIPEGTPKTVAPPFTSWNIKKEKLCDTSGMEATDMSLWTEEDASILYDGDEDCYITLVRKPWDITVLELSDDEDGGSSATMNASSRRRKSCPVYVQTITGVSG